MITHRPRITTAEARRRARLLCNGAANDASRRVVERITGCACAPAAQRRGPPGLRQHERQH
jgi:hypothetical protein